MVKVIEVGSGTKLIDLNLNPASAPRTGEYINLKRVGYVIVSRTYDFSELGNLECVVLKVTRID